MNPHSPTATAPSGTAVVPAPRIRSSGRSPRAHVRSIIAAQAAASVGVSAVAAAGGLLATDLAGPTAAATPLGALVIGSGAGAMMITRITQRHGRTRGLHVGYLVASCGAVVGLLAARTGSLIVLLTGTALIGVGNSGAMLSRYALADLAPVDERARTIGRSLLAVAAGSILGPLLLAPVGRAAAVVSMPPASGTYAAAAFVLLLASLRVVAGRPSTGVRRAIVMSVAASLTASPRNSSTSRPGSTRRALFAMASANLTMVTMMAVYPSHLHHAGHSLGTTSLVVSAHVGAMFAASPVLGRLTDSHGPNRVLAVGGVAICTACLTTAILPADDARAATIALVVLGLGWSAQLVAGSALLTDGVGVDRRARLEGLGEIAMSAAAAAGALVLAPVLISRTGIRPLAGAMIPINAIVVASAIAATRLRTRRARPPLTPTRNTETSP